jgi:hypothetical protein
MYDSKLSHNILFTMSMVRVVVTGRDCTASADDWSKLGHCRMMGYTTRQ